MSDVEERVPGPETHETLAADGAFETAVRGYNKRQVDEFTVRSHRHVSDLEGRLSQARGEAERLRAQIAALQQAASKRAHEEVSQRIAQILKLAEDEALAQKTRAAEESAALRAQAQQDAEASRAQASGRADQMLATARDQAERVVADALAEADSTLSAARAEADKATAEAGQYAKATLAEAMALGKQMLDTASARSAAINDISERRLTFLVANHTEAIRRLTEMRDVITMLVAQDNEKGTLEEQVASTAAAALASPDRTQADSAHTDSAQADSSQTAGGGSAVRGTAAPAARSPADPRESVT